MRAAEPGTPAAPSIEYARATYLDPRLPEGPGRDALVILEFDVLANGKTANITLVEEGFYEERFVKEAIRALRYSKWKPRRVNGKPVDSTGLRKESATTSTPFSRPNLPRHTR
jgi:hypothetical protein